MAARIINHSIGGLRHASAFYSPSSLYNEVERALQEKSIIPDTTQVGNELADSVDSILKLKDTDVEGMPEKNQLAAIRALTLKVASASTRDDNSMKSISQKQLANALIRYSLFRGK